MIKYADYSIVFREVPEEITLAFSITNCQGNCPGCHSPHLREDIGNDLIKDLPALMEKYKGMITCVCFLGEGNDPGALRDCLKLVKEAGLKTCVYSGKDEPPIFYMYNAALIDYLKYGSYQEEKGPLDNPNTNQRMVRFVPGDVTPHGQAYSAYDITDSFWATPFD